jgi:AraC family transcriptional regulator of adaptative response / DNA-3-methyladenine glycosylase II
MWALLERQGGVAAARNLAGRLVLRAGREAASGADGLTHLFPRPSELAAADLSGLGIDDASAATLKKLARAVARGSIDLAAPAHQLQRALAALPGLGPSIAEYVALRALGQPDAFPAGDLALRRAAAARSRPLAASELEQAAERWRPWRGYAAVHLWAAPTRPAEVRPSPGTREAVL